MSTEKFQIIVITNELITYCFVCTHPGTYSLQFNVLSKAIEVTKGTEFCMLNVRR